jgi:hypothetical protein
MLINALIMYYGDVITFSITRIRCLSLVSSDLGRNALVADLSRRSTAGLSPRLLSSVVVDETESGFFLEVSSRSWFS